MTFVTIQNSAGDAHFPRRKRLYKDKKVMIINIYILLNTDRTPVITWLYRQLYLYRQLCGKP